VRSAKTAVERLSHTLRVRQVTVSAFAQSL